MTTSTRSPASRTCFEIRCRPTFRSFRLASSPNPKAGSPSHAFIGQAGRPRWSRSTQAAPWCRKIRHGQGRTQQPPGAGPYPMARGSMPGISPRPRTARRAGKVCMAAARRSAWVGADSITPILGVGERHVDTQCLRGKVRGGKSADSAGGLDKDPRLNCRDIWAAQGGCMSTRVDTSAPGDESAAQVLARIARALRDRDPKLTQAQALLKASRDPEFVAKNKEETTTRMIRASRLYG